ncbi:Hypothetical protein GL50581_3034 [Giardia duodenalis ATCC 50581]|nr:Hypothetical protein GL50581_3034 [Giardia intestinalis ATCC 50581]
MAFSNVHTYTMGLVPDTRGTCFIPVIPTTPQPAGIISRSFPTSSSASAINGTAIMADFLHRDRHRRI